MKIDINKKYRYREGGLARVLCIDAPGEYPVVTIDDSGNPQTHNEQGWQLTSGREMAGDLIEIREPREWVMHVKPGTQKVAAIYEEGGEPASDPWECIRVREIID